VALVKIVYLGNFTQPWCTEVHLAREMEALGHTVLRLQEPQGGGADRHVRKVTDAGSQADLVLWTRTWGLPETATDAWRWLEARGVTTASYHLDLYRGLQREEGVASDPFWTTGHVFTPDGNLETEAWLAAQGVNHHWLPPGVVSDECRRGTPRPEYAHDVIFVGSERYHPEWPHRPKLIAWLADRYGERFRRYGGDGDAALARGQDLNDLYASAKVVVGDSCFASRPTRYWSDRPYETWGRGGFLIFPRIDALAAQLGDYPSWEPGDWDALASCIDGCLLEPYARAQIAGGLFTAVTAAHSYRHRLAEAFRTMGLA